MTDFSLILNKHHSTMSTNKYLKEKVYYYFPNFTHYFVVIL